MREAQYLRQRYRAMLAHVGLIVGLTGPLFLAPLLALPAALRDVRLTVGFLLPALTLTLGGFTLWRRRGAGEEILSVQEGGVIVVLSWLVASIAGAVPFLVGMKLTPSQAIFESVSGWTTTGLSVVDVTRAPAAILLWRSLLQLAGGAGLAILMLAALAGPAGSSLAAAEGRGDSLVPNVRASAILVVRIYTASCLLGAVALRLAGMTWFDAVNHSFCALSTGGFSTRADSIGSWDSPGIESVTLVLMLFGNLNFITAWCLLRGKFGAVLRNGEVRVLGVLLALAPALLLWLTCAPLYASAPKACRVALFEAVSALTTTGYSTVGYQDWNAFGILILIVLMLIGGGTCSTAGALKQYRVSVLFHLLVQELRRPFLPRTAVPDSSVWIGEERVALTEGQVRSMAAYVFLYLLTWLTGSAVLAALGATLPDALFEFASALGTVGLSVGVTRPGATGVLWTETAGMLLGRLEFFVIFTSAARLVRDSWRMARREA